MRIIKSQSYGRLLKCCTSEQVICVLSTSCTLGKGYCFLCAPVHIQTSAHRSPERMITKALSIFLINNWGLDVCVLWSTFEAEVAINICCTSLACSQFLCFPVVISTFLFAPRICYWWLVFMSPLMFPLSFLLLSVSALWTWGMLRCRIKKISQLKYLLLFFQTSVYLNISQCTSISSKGVLLGPVCAAFLGCQQMEKVLEKSVNVTWMIGNHLFLYTQERSLKK